MKSLKPLWLVPEGREPEKGETAPPLGGCIQPHGSGFSDVGAVSLSSPNSPSREPGGTKHPLRRRQTPGHAHNPVSRDAVDGFDALRAGAGKGSSPWALGRLCASGGFCVDDLHDIPREGEIALEVRGPSSSPCAWKLPSSGLCRGGIAAHKRSFAVLRTNISVESHTVPRALGCGLAA
jgi:hypothetical protein